MEWEDKTTMVKLGNAMNSDATPDPEKEKAFREYVLSKLQDFDVQAFDMFITIIELIPDKIKEHVDFYRQVNNKLQEMLKNPNISFGLRSSMRFAMLEVLIEDAEKE